MKKSCYVDGKPKPFFRGCLHGFVFIIIVFSIVVVVLAISFGQLSSKWWGIVGFLSGKGACYGVSAVLHLHKFTSVAGVTNALRIDLMMVSTSILGTTAPIRFMIEHRTSYIYFLIEVGLCVANALLVVNQFSGHIGLDTPKGRSDTPREILVVVHFLWSIGITAVYWGFDGWLIAAVSYYALAFALSVPVTRAHFEEPVSEILFWHKIQVWGFHEDFHLALLFADGSMLVIGVLLLMRS